MNFSGLLTSLREIDFNDLDLKDPGSWPSAVRIIAVVLAVLLLLALGYNLYIRDLQSTLESQLGQEQSLKQQFSTKAFQAASLDAYKQQMVEAEASFGELLKQLPSDTEVPGLLEDITRLGLSSGLEFEEIKLLPEVTQQFYIELPIQIKVVGDYHSLAAFVSAVTSQPRIVTLHDFDLLPAVAGNASRLRMQILAKTYRYNDKGVKP